MPHPLWVAPFELVLIDWPQFRFSPWTSGQNFGIQRTQRHPKTPCLGFLHFLHVSPHNNWIQLVSCITILVNYHPTSSNYRPNHEGALEPQVEGVQRAFDCDDCDESKSIGASNMWRSKILPLFVWRILCVASAANWYWLVNDESAISQTCFQF